MTAKAKTEKEIAVDTQIEEQIKALQAHANQVKAFNEDITVLYADIFIEANVENIYKLFEDKLNFETELKTVQESKLFWETKQNVIATEADAQTYVKELFALQVKTNKEYLQKTLALHLQVFKLYNNLMVKVSAQDTSNPNVANKVTMITTWIQQNVTKSSNAITGARKQTNDLELIERQFDTSQYVKNTLAMLQQQEIFLTNEIDKLNGYIAIEADVLEILAPQAYAEWLQVKDRHSISHPE